MANIPAPIFNQTLSEAGAHALILAVHAEALRERWPRRRSTTISRMDWYLSAGLFSKAFSTDVSVGLGDLFAQRRQFAVDDRFQDLQVRPAAKRALAREHFVEHDAEGKDVAARIERLA